MSMKKICLLFLVALFGCCLCACEADPTVSQEISHEVSEVTSVSCVHSFDDDPVEIVGNLYVFECTHCGERKVVPQGILIGEEE